MPPPTYLDGSSKAALSTTPTDSKFSQPACETASSTKPPSSGALTSSWSPVQLVNTGDISTWLQGDSPASHSPPQESNSVPMILVTSGPLPPGSFAKYSPARRSWRTFQVSLLTGTSEPYSESWPRAGMTQDGIVLQREPLAPLTAETGSGSSHQDALPTPSATTCGSSGNGSGNNTRSRGRASLEAMARKGLIPTPTVHNGNKSSRISQEHANSMKVGFTLGQAVNLQAPGRQVHLNPDFWEWTMGWPIGSTALQPVETDKFQEWLLSHGIDSQVPAGGNDATVNDG